MKIEIEFNSDSVDICVLSDILDELASILPTEPNIMPQYAKADSIEVIGSNNKVLYALKKFPNKVVTKSGITIRHLGSC